MKLSLRTLMLVVALVALITAALAQPSLFWMRLMFTATVAFLAMAAVGALTTKDKQRAFWVGAAICGGGYFLLLIEGQQVQFSPSGPAMHRALLSQMLLDKLAEARGLTVRSPFSGFQLWDEQIYQTSSGGTGGFGGASSPSPMGPPAPGGGGFFDVQPEGVEESSAAAAQASFGASSLEENSDGGASGSAGSLGPPPGMPGGSMPGAPGPGMGAPSGSGMMGAGAPPMPATFTFASYNHFLIAGHCAFVILVGLIGGLASRWAFGREET